MFERYTEKARRAIFFARYEASALGLIYINSDCLLLGLVRENGAISTQWLGLGPTELREIIESRTMRGKQLSTSVDLPLDDPAKRVLNNAAEEAERLSHQHIGTEHLFLGLLREPDTFAAKRIKERGMTIEQIRAAMAQTEEASEKRPTSLLGRNFGTFQSGNGMRIRLVSESGEDLVALQWMERVPATGESIWLADTKYRILELAWRVETSEGSAAHVHEVVLKVRKE